LVTIHELNINLKSLLKQNNIENYTFEAHCILEHVLELSYEQLIIKSNAYISSQQIEIIQRIADKRISGYPLQYILGEWEFYGLPFYLGEGVLIPRQDTEKLVDSILEIAAPIRNPKIIDLCSGTGCIAIALDKHLINSQICAVEHSPEALKFLLRNIHLNGSAVNAYDGNVLNKEFSKTFSDINIIAANPPYLTPEDMINLQKEVSFEPEMALLGGNDGLFFYRNITSIWKDCLADKGTLIYEIGIGQENAVADIMEEYGFKNIQFQTDLNGLIRVVSGVYNISKQNHQPS